MSVVIAILIGLMLGSFLSVLIARWPHWRGVVSGRSVCPYDGHTLAWYELVPLISWLVQGGRCRVCSKPISPWYPVYELTMAGALALAVPHGWLSVAAVAVLIALFFFDVRRMVLPDVLVAALGLLAVAGLTLGQGNTVHAFEAAAALAGGFGALFVFSRGRWLGLGDVKLGAVLGLWFGLRTGVYVTVIAIYIGALVGLALLSTQRASGKTALPFGAFWTAVAIAAILAPTTISRIGGILVPW